MAELIHPRDLKVGDVYCDSWQMHLPNVGLQRVTKTSVLVVSWRYVIIEFDDQSRAGSGKSQYRDDDAAKHRLFRVRQISDFVEGYPASDRIVDAVEDVPASGHVIIWRDKDGELWA